MELGQQDAERFASEQGTGHGFLLSGRFKARVGRRKGARICRDLRRFREAGGGGRRLKRTKDQKDFKDPKDDKQKRKRCC
jgi:hypothetical protein